MKYIVPVLIALFGSALLHAQVFPVDTLLKNGPINERVNLVFVGDGYTLNEQVAFIEDAEDLTEALFAQSPFKEYKSHFNVFTISVPSNVSGAASTPSQPIDNYFGSTFNYGGIDRLLVPAKSNKVTAVLADNFPQYDQVFMIVNSTKYGGSGGWIATSSVHASAGEIAIHEMGHSFADLRDEYWAGAQYALEKANMTRESNPKLVRWKNWVGINGIGVYSHSSPGNNWYRPHQSCKMQFLGTDFCSVCRETIVEKVLTLTEPIAGYAPGIGTSVALKDTVHFSVDLLEPDPNTINAIWTIDGKSVGKGAAFELVRSDLSRDTSEIEVDVFDETPFSKKDNATTYRRYFLTWEVVKAVSIEIEAPVVQEHQIVIYPNPSTDFIKVEGLDNSATLRVVNASGQEVIAPAIGSQLDVQALQAGVYFLQVQWKGQVLQHAFVKK